MVSIEEYIILFEKYLAGDASPEEIEKIMAYKDHLESVDLLPSEIPVGQDVIVKARIFDKITHTTGHKKVVKILHQRVWWSAAAAAIIIGVFSLFYWNGRTGEKLIAKNQISVSKSEIVPGTSKAILKLANGKQIILNDAADGMLVQQGNITIKKQKNGMVQYLVSGGSAGDSGTDRGFNTITTPRGGEYQIELPDGSKVWLNSATSLTFPNAFIGKERRVELTGEGYFEVTKNKDKPFIVQANGTDVLVLGTHFNVSAYHDDQFVTTTLLEGSVQLSKESASVILKPGQQGSSINGQAAMSVKKANLEQVMAWKNGYFLFNNTDIKTIMKQAARWYDIEVVYSGNQENKQFGGKISKYGDISKLLENLELTGTIEFKLEGRRVTVK